MVFVMEYCDEQAELHSSVPTGVAIANHTERWPPHSAQQSVRLTMPCW